MHTIRHGAFAATIAAEGAELKSFREENSGEEYIWQGDPAIWAGSAPILFPIVGRLKGGGFLHDGQRYALEKHGIARRARFSPGRGGDGEASFLLRSSAETLAVYPFAFELEVRFRIGAGSLHVGYTVRNGGDGPMHFTLGSHPAFALPVDRCPLEEHYVEFAEEERLDRYFLDDGLLCAEPERNFLDGEKRIPLTATLFERDALIFRNIRSRTIALGNLREGRRILLETGGAPHIGVWAKPAAPYVCLEPWYGHDDGADAPEELAAREGIMALTPGGRFETGYVIRV